MQPAQRLDSRVLMRLAAPPCPQVIGKTPMVKLNRIPQSEGAVATVVAKLESCEPCSSGAS